jgi:hypothetical protein
MGTSFQYGGHQPLFRDISRFSRNLRFLSVFQPLWNRPSADKLRLKELRKATILVFILRSGLVIGIECNWFWGQL